jgi:hypothetical protein
MKKQSSAPVSQFAKEAARFRSLSDKLDLGSVASRCAFKGNGSALSLDVLISLKYWR